MKLSIAVPMIIVAALGVSAAPSAAASIPGEVTTNPCKRLTADEVLYDTHDADRVTFATAKSYRDTEVLITGCVNTADGYVQEWQSTGFAGRTGFAPPGEMWQNTLYSPSGSFSFTEALGREDPGTELEYHTINRSSRWGGERGPNYNQYFEGVDGGADENLWFYLQQGYYEQAAVINWNREPDMPTVQGASFAIFFHAGNALTVGCISTDLATVIGLLKAATPGDRIVMGVEDAVFAADTTVGQGQDRGQDSDLDSDRDLGASSTPDISSTPDVDPAAGAAEASALSEEAEPQFPSGAVIAGSGLVAVLVAALALMGRRRRPGR